MRRMGIPLLQTLHSRRKVAQARRELGSGDSSGVTATCHRTPHHSIGSCQLGFCKYNPKSLSPKWSSQTTHSHNPRSADILFCPELSTFDSKRGVATTPNRKCSLAVVKREKPHKTGISLCEQKRAKTSPRSTLAVGKRKKLAQEKIGRKLLKVILEVRNFRPMTTFFRARFEPLERYLRFHQGFRYLRF